MANDLPALRFPIIHYLKSDDRQEDLYQRLVDFFGDNLQMASRNISSEWRALDCWWRSRPNFGGYHSCSVAENDPTRPNQTCQTTTEQFLNYFHLDFKHVFSLSLSSFATLKLQRWCVPTIARRNPAPVPSNWVFWKTPGRSRTTYDPIKRMSFSPEHNNRPLTAPNLRVSFWMKVTPLYSSMPLLFLSPAPPSPSHPVCRLSLESALSNLLFWAPSTALTLCSLP